MTKTIKELLDEYKKLAVLTNYAKEDDFKQFLAEGEARMEEIISQVEALVRKETVEEERQFILNVLDGVDIADKQMGVTGGTQAIRQALQSRT